MGRMLTMLPETWIGRLCSPPDPCIRADYCVNWSSVCAGTVQIPFAGLSPITSHKETLSYGLNPGSKQDPSLRDQSSNPTCHVGVLPEGKRGSCFCRCGSQAAPSSHPESPLQPVPLQAFEKKYPQALSFHMAFITVPSCTENLPHHTLL